MSRLLSRRNPWLSTALLGLILVAALPTQAATSVSDLLIQGDFGAGGTLANYEWQVTYNSSTTLTGQGLLNAVFGVPVDQNTTVPTNYGSYELFKATSSQGTASYIDFGGGSYFMVGMTLGGITVPATVDPSLNTGWNYIVSGGGGASGSDGSGADYAPNIWTYSGDGSTTRLEASGSYDAWVFGDTSTTDSPAGISPTSADFTSATVINLTATPEPSRFMLLCAGFCLMALRRARRTTP